MKSRYQSKYSAYSPNYEPMTPYGQMRKRMQEVQKQKKVNIFGVQRAQKGLQDIYRVNNEIFQEMKSLHDKQLMCENEGNKINALLQLKKGFEKMQKMAKSVGVDEDLTIEGDSDDDKLKKQILSDLKNAKSLMVMLEKFGGK